jgi:hypothetical protein
MDNTQQDLIDAVLSSEGVDDDVLLAVERLGDAAFDELSQRLRTGLLAPLQQVLALRTLSRLTRQNCAMRKEEVLELAVDRFRSDSRIVRSGAVNTAIWTAITLEENPKLATRQENRPGATPGLRARVKKALSHAVQLGIDEEQAEFARAYLTH